jgi:hypothetical protein
VRVAGTAQRDAWLARTFPPVEQAAFGRAAIAEAAAHLRHLADEGRISATAAASGEPERYRLPHPR